MLISLVSPNHCFLSSILARLKAASACPGWTRCSAGPSETYYQLGKKRSSLISHVAYTTPNGVFSMSIVCLHHAIDAYCSEAYAIVRWTSKILSQASRHFVPLTRTIRLLQVFSLSSLKPSVKPSCPRGYYSIPSAATLCRAIVLFSIILALFSSLLPVSTNSTQSSLSPSIFSTMRISALLNPAPDTYHQPASQERRRSLRPRRLTNESSPVDDSSDYMPEQISRNSKVKHTKDAPKFEKGEAVGVVAFPPYEVFDSDLVKHIKEFKILPASAIASYPRHIPYSSDKKEFLNKTGRDSFEGMSSSTTIDCKVLLTVPSLSVHLQSEGRR